MVEVERKERKILPTTRIISMFILVISMIVLAFSTNKIYEYYVLTQTKEELVNRRNQLIEENEVLKTEIRTLKSNMEALKYGEKEITNVDLIRRVSQLEKIILGKENN